MQVVEHMDEPFLRVDAYDVAAPEEGVEDGVVDGAAVVLAEKVVLAAHRRRALVALQIEIKICVVHNKNSLVILLTKLLLLLRCPKDKIKMLKSNLISCLYHQNSLFHDIFFDILVFPL